MLPGCKLQQQQQRHDNSVVFSPGGAVKAKLDKQTTEEGAGHRTEGNARLSLCSLVSGFINKHSLLLLSTTEIPPSPISADDSLQLLKSGRCG